MDRTDPHKRRALVEKCRALGVEQGQLLAVSLEEFFEGNDDPGSLCCNVPDHPGMPALYNALRAIRDRSDVQDVVVVIREVTDDGSWPFSSDVYLLTTAGPEEAADMVHAYLPEGAWPDSMDQPSERVPRNMPRPAPNCMVYDLWWD